MGEARISDPTLDHQTPLQATKTLHVSLKTIRRWLAEGKFPGAWQTAAGRWWIPHVDLAGWRVPRETETKET